MRDLNPNKLIGSGSLFWFQIITYLKLLTNYSTKHMQQYEYNNCYLATLWFDNFCYVADRNFLGALRSIPKSLEYNFAGFFRYYWKNVGNI